MSTFRELVLEYIEIIHGDNPTSLEMHSHQRLIKDRLMTKIHQGRVDDLVILFSISQIEYMSTTHKTTPLHLFCEFLDGDDAPEIIDDLCKLANTTQQLSRIVNSARETILHSMMYSFNFTGCCVGKTVIEINKTSIESVKKVIDIDKKMSTKLNRKSQTPIDLLKSLELTSSNYDNNNKSIDEIVTHVTSLII